MGLPQEVGPDLIDRIAGGDPVLILLIVGFTGLVSAFIWVVKQWVRTQGSLTELLKTTLSTLESLDLHSESLSRDMARLETRFFEIATDLKNHISTLLK